MQFRAQDIGKRKDEAMVSMLRKFNPDVAVRAAAISLQRPHGVLHALREICRRTRDEKDGNSSNEDDSDEEDEEDFDESDESETDSEAPNEDSGLETQEPAAPLSSTTAVPPLPAINRRNRRLSVVFLCIQRVELANALNEFCCEFGIAFVYVFVGRDGISGELLSVILGRSSCLQCLDKRKIFKANSTTDDTNDNDDEASRMRDGAAGAHQSPRRLGLCLPSTECILAGLAMQNALMELLSFGSFCSRVEYDGILDELDRSGFLPPVHLCPSSYCRQQQHTYASTKS